MSNNIILKLKAFGFNTDMAIKYCADDVEFYISILEDYVNSYASSSENLEKLFVAQNWKEYRVLIHSLKSSAKTVGADALSESARLLEEASKTEDVEYITRLSQKL
ncbi:MAG: Hpt domain-containing protein [Oscillospiraceae bacterium]|nr:Hpt domain-containing protein [Oscillospiraceae bacterium]